MEVLGCTGKGKQGIVYHVQFKVPFHIFSRKKAFDKNPHDWSRHSLSGQMRCSTHERGSLYYGLIKQQNAIYFDPSFFDKHTFDTWVTYLPGMGLVLALHRFWGQEVRMALGFTILIRGCIYLQYLYLYLYMCVYWNLYLYMFCNFLYLYGYLSILCLCYVPIYLVIYLSILSYLILSIQIPAVLIRIPTQQKASGDNLPEISKSASFAQLEYSNSPNFCLLETSFMSTPFRVNPVFPFGSKVLKNLKSYGEECKKTNLIQAITVQALQVGKKGSMPGDNNDGLLWLFTCLQKLLDVWLSNFNLQVCCWWVFGAQISHP